jgi:transcriptional regulator with PAS, ATPase and Fis domain/Tfp pilus assembly protein PilF
VNVITQDHLEQISQLLDSAEFASVAQMFAAVRASELRTSSSLDRSRFHFLYGRFLFSQGEYGKALTKVRCALRLSRSGSDHALFAREKHLLGMIYRQMGRMEEAGEEFLESFASHKRSQNNSDIFRPLLSLGLTHLYRGDLTQARRVFFEALSYAKRYNSLQEERRCQLNQMLVQLLSGEFSEYRSTLAALRSQPLGVIDTAHVTKHTGQLAVLLLESDNVREQLKNAMIVYAREHIQRDYVVCLEYLGMNEYFAGNYAKAKEYYQQVLDMPEPTASAVAQTLRMLTDVYVAERDWKNAKETAAKAEQAITKINERIELAALWRAQAQIAEHDRDHDTGRDFFQKSIDLLKQCGARYELALTHFAVGQSTVHSSATRLEHLQQAKTLFVEMDVPKRVAEIEVALAAIDRLPHQVCRLRAGEVFEQPVIVTQDTRMLEVIARANAIKDTSLIVLITGETGTGKDLLAKYIHVTSRRAGHPFRLQNAATLTETLIEGQLFGHRRGAFTGALEDRPGLIESAHQGTFALNEIGELSLVLQAKLLDVLETGTVTRVGDSRARAMDVRFLVMTNKDLEQMLASGRFREDLYYRVSQVHLHLPPLRDRKDDIPCLLQHFLEQEDYGKYTPDQARLIADESALAHHHWPGNVRELLSVVKKSCAFAPTRRPLDLTAALKIHLSELRAKGSDKIRLQAAVERNSGNLAAAARELDMPESTLRRHLRSLTCG